MVHIAKSPFIDSFCEDVLESLIFHWVRVGKLFPHARPPNFEMRFDFSFSRSAIIENDFKNPIICENFCARRTDIFDSLRKEIGPSLYSYFYQNDDLAEESTKELDSKKRRYWLNTEETIKAFTEIIAFLISEDKPPNLGSKTKNLRNDYEKDITQSELEKTLKKLKTMKKTVRGDSKLNPELVNNLTCSNNLKKFLPGFEIELENFKENFEKFSLDEIIEMIDNSNSQKRIESDRKTQTIGFLSRIYSLTHKNREVLENAIIAIDRDLRLYFSDKRLIEELESASVIPNCTNDLKNFSKSENGPLTQFSVEISDLIKAIVDDLAESFSGRVKLKEYSTLRKAIAEYRNKYSFYIFDPKSFSTRKR